ncbi:MAG: hypothetical protein ABFD69_09190 [Candidatus Sumerlaeia bacterium]
MPTRPNYLAAMIWGRRPKSARRRRRAWSCRYGPTTSYLVIFGIILTVGLLIASAFGIVAEEEFVTVYCASLLTAAFFLGAIYCIALPFMLENRFSNARVLQANCHDYRLAGMSGREMLNGLAGPQLAGIKLFAKVYVGVVFSIGAVSTAVQPDFLRGMLTFSMLLIPFLLDLIAGSYFHLTLWTKYPSKPQRLLMTAVFVFSSPVTLLTATLPLSVPIIAMVPFMFGIFIVLELLSLAVRAAVIGSAWSAAKERLDGNAEQIPRLYDEPAAEETAVADRSG